MNTIDTLPIRAVAKCHFLSSVKESRGEQSPAAKYRLLIGASDECIEVSFSALSVCIGLCFL